MTRGRLTDLAGQKFGRLSAIQRNGTHKSGDAMWKCLCDCGAEKSVRAIHLRSGKSRSCGCLALEEKSDRAKTHGLHQAREYRIWAQMKQRCGNPKNRAYPDYGGRGISVCEKWVSSFEMFYADMGQCPSGMTLERRDVDQGYDPGNCKWATRKEQARNKRDNRVVTYMDESLCIQAWAERFGMNAASLRARIFRLGWDVEKAFMTPTKKTKRWK